MSHAALRECLVDGETLFLWGKGPDVNNPKIIIQGGRVLPSEKLFEMDQVKTNENRLFSLLVVTGLLIFLGLSVMAIYAMQPKVAQKLYEWRVMHSWVIRK